MLDDKTLAMLGDKAAAERLTERGELLPCPGCNEEEVKHRSVMACVMIECQCGFMAAGYDLDEARRIWNTRAPILRRSRSRDWSKWNENSSWAGN